MNLKKEVDDKNGEIELLKKKLADVELDNKKKLLEVTLENEILKNKINSLQNDLNYVSKF